MSRVELYCFNCGASLEVLPQPLGRLAECLTCRAELHVCRMCEFYDTRVAQACREPMAEEVKDKTRANFCEFFAARPGRHPVTPSRGGDDPRHALEALFGGEDGGKTGDDEPASGLDALFRKDE